MPSQTMVRFGFPDTTIREYDHWVVLLREQQVTLGSLVLCSKSDVTAFSNLPAASFEEMGRVVNDIERALASAFEFDKINYLMLMMVDPNVHFHVIPRYAEERRMGELAIIDQGWPSQPRLDVFHELTAVERAKLRKHIESFW